MNFLHLGLICIACLIAYGVGYSNGKMDGFIEGFLGPHHTEEENDVA